MYLYVIFARSIWQGIYTLPTYAILNTEGNYGIKQSFYKDERQWSRPSYSKLNEVVS